MKGPIYTADEDARLRELFGRRVAVRAIALAMGRSYNSVQGRIYVLGLRSWKTGRWLPEEDAQLSSLYLASIGAADIAATLNRTVSAVRKRIFDLGLKRDHRRVRLAQRYGTEALANGKDTTLILAEIREAEQRQREATAAAEAAKVSALLDEMQRGLDAGCDRAFMFTAALVGGATLQQIGERVGITRERVRQVIEERKAMGAQS